MYKRCISIGSCSQTRPGICSQTRPGISLCSLFGLSLQGRGHFLVLLNQSEQDQESLSALALDCLCQTGLTPWSVSLLFYRTILLFLLLCKIMFLCPVGALLRAAIRDSCDVWYIADLLFTQSIRLISSCQRYE